MMLPVLVVGGLVTAGVLVYRNATSSPDDTFKISPRALNTVSKDIMHESAVRNKTILRQEKRLAAYNKAKRIGHIKHWFGAHDIESAQLAQRCAIAWYHAHPLSVV